MDIKEDLKDAIKERLNDVVSHIFLKRVFEVIDESANDKDSLISAAERVSKRVELFIDKSIAKELFEDLKMKIDGSSL